MLSLKKKSIIKLNKKKKDKEKTILVISNDYLQIVIFENVGVDAIFVKDSHEMTTLSYDSALLVTMNDMLRHFRGLARGGKKPFLIGDMPFLSYQISNSEAVRNSALPVFMMAEFGDDLKLFDNNDQDTQNETA